MSLIGIIYGALLAIGQTDIKRLIAYTSISHFGFITLGIFVLTSQGRAVRPYMVNHGFRPPHCSWWPIPDEQARSKLVDDYGGVQRRAAGRGSS